MPNYTERSTYSAPSIADRDPGYDADMEGDGEELTYWDWVFGVWEDDDG